MHKFHNPGGALADASGGALADASGGAGALPDASARGIDASARGTRCDPSTPVDVIPFNDIVKVLAFIFCFCKNKIKDIIMKVWSKTERFL